MSEICKSFGVKLKPLHPSATFYNQAHSGVEQCLVRCSSLSLSMVQGCAQAKSALTVYPHSWPGLFLPFQETDFQAVPQSVSSVPG